MESIKNKTNTQLNNMSNQLSTPQPKASKDAKSTGKLLIFSAPSGAGKSTIVQWLMQEHPELRLAFSISCTVVFDVDVKGGCNIKRFYGERALSFFIQPPSLDELRRRLVSRQTDSAEAIESRLAKASYELTFADKFDKVIVNDDLDKAKQEVYETIKAFL